MTITTKIINVTTGLVAGTSCTATDVEPCEGHTAEIGEEVYDLLDADWDGAEAHAVALDGTEYRLERRS